MKQATGTIIKFYNEHTGSDEVERSYTKIPNSVIFDKLLSDSAKALYICLLALSWRLQNRPLVNGGIVVTQEQLINWLAFSRRKLNYKITELEQNGYCKREKLNNKLTVLTVIIKKSASDEWQDFLEEIQRELQG